MSNLNKRNTRNRRVRRTPYGFKASSSLHVNAIMPVRVERNLFYIDGNYNRSNGGANYLAYAIRINDLYDPDPLILSGLVSGFKEIMQFYNYYRVLNTTVELKISNNETFSLLWGLFFSTTNYVGSLANRDAAINTLENGMTSGAKLLAAKGGMDRDSIKVSIPVSQILGNEKEYLAEAGYSGIGLASPGIPVYMNLIIASPSAAALPNGVTTFLKIGFNAEFFGKVNLQS